MKKNYASMTKAELVARMEKRRKYQREYKKRPEVKQARREYHRKVREGYLAAKKAGLL